MKKINCQSRNCKNCVLYKAYFVKGLTKFVKMKYGCCDVQGKEVKEDDACCKDFILNEYFYVTRKRVTLQKLEDICDRLLEIRDIFQDDRKERMDLHNSTKKTGRNSAE